MKRIGKKDKRENDPNKSLEDFLKIFYSGEVRELEKDLDRMKEIFQIYNLNAAFGYDEKTAVFLQIIYHGKQYGGWYNRGRISMREINGD